QLKKLDIIAGSKEKFFACRVCYNKATKTRDPEESTADQGEGIFLPPTNTEIENAEENPNTIYLVDRVHIKEEKCDTDSEENYDIGNEEISQNMDKEYDVESMECDVLLKEEGNSE
ncbi:hypothetical protein SK128_027629, partial [Halocaridina rubra]